MIDQAIYPTSFDYRCIGRRQFCVVYFLIKAGDVVYVGRTENLSFRIRTHELSSIDFDTFCFIPSCIENVGKTEMKAIKLYQPEHNSSLHKTNYITKSKVIGELLEIVAEALAPYPSQEVNRKVKFIDPKNMGEIMSSIAEMIINKYGR